MKKITLMLAFIGMISLQSCTVHDEPQINEVTNNYTFVAPVFEVTRSFTAPSFSTIVDFPAVINPIYPSDMVLAYRLDGTASNGDDIWKLMPQTFYFADGTRDFSYEFNFTMRDIELRMEGNDLGSVSSAYRINQVFRVVIVPADFTNRLSTPIDYKDYNAVIQALQIDESKILKIN